MKLKYKDFQDFDSVHTGKLGKVPSAKSQLKNHRTVLADGFRASAFQRRSPSGPSIGGQGVDGSAADGGGRGVVLGKQPGGMEPAAARSVAMGPIGGPVDRKLWSQT